MFSKKVLNIAFTLICIAGFVLYTNLADGQAVTDALISYWSCDNIQNNTVEDSVGGQDATVNGDPEVVAGKVGSAIEFDGDDWLLITDDFNAAKLPTKEMTVEAWVYPVDFDDWGAFISYDQDNGGFEKGWILGTVNNTEGAGANEFSFAISTADADDGDGDLTYFHAGPYDPEKWYHVVGVYDGSSTRIYIDGELVVDSEEQSGDINYPDSGFFTIGVYKDDNEHFPHLGMLDELRLYEKALNKSEVLQNYDAQGLSVEPAGKLSLTWGEIKTRR